MRRNKTQIYKYTRQCIQNNKIHIKTGMGMGLDGYELSF